MQITISGIFTFNLQLFCAICPERHQI